MCIEYYPEELGFDEKKIQMTSWSVLGHKKMIVTITQVKSSDEEWV